MLTRLLRCRLPLLALGLLVTSATGCLLLAPDEEPTDPPEVAFSFTGHGGLSGFAYALAPDEPIQTNDFLGIAIENLPFVAQLHARTSTETSYVVGLYADDFCSDPELEASDIDVAQADPCPTGWVRHATWFAQVGDSVAETFELEVTDEQGHVLGSHTFEAAKPASASVYGKVSKSDVTQGFTVSSTGYEVLEPTLFDARGRELFYGDEGVRWTNEREDLIGEPLLALFYDFLGAPTDDILAAIAPGSTVVTLVADDFALPIPVVITP